MHGHQELETASTIGALIGAVAAVLILNSPHALPSTGHAVQDAVAAIRTASDRNRESWRSVACVNRALNGETDQCEWRATAGDGAEGDGLKLVDAHAATTNGRPRFGGTGTKAIFM